jgi:hypothetical protein
MAQPVSKVIGNFVWVGTFLYVITRFLGDDNEQDVKFQQRESSLVESGLPVCDSLSVQREISLLLRREKIDEAQEKINGYVREGRCTTSYYKNEKIVLTGYSNGYYQFHIKGTDDTPKRTYYANSELIVAGWAK